MLFEQGTLSCKTKLEIQVHGNVEVICQLYRSIEKEQRKAKLVIYIPTSPIALGSARKNEIADTSGQNELRLEGVWAQHYRSGEGLRASARH